MSRLDSGPPLVLAGVATPFAATLWWMLIDDISARQAFASRIPYVLGGLTWFVALPLYAATLSWHRHRLARLLLMASIGAAPIAIKAIHYFLTPRDIFAAGLVFTTAWVATAIFWAVVRVLGDAHENARPD